MPKKVLIFSHDINLFMHLSCALVVKETVLHLEKTFASNFSISQWRTDDPFSTGNFLKKKKRNSIRGRTVHAPVRHSEQKKKNTNQRKSKHEIIFSLYEQNKLER